MIDVREVVAMRHVAGATVVADNIFLSPALLRPLTLEVDVVVNSATKFLCGHGDSLSGIVISNNAEFIAKLRKARQIYGGVLSPFNAFLVLRGIETLPVRVKQHCANAQTIAKLSHSIRQLPRSVIPVCPVITPTKQHRIYWLVSVTWSIL